MTDAPEGEGLPPSLRFLKWLVILLTLTMIGGVITVVGLLVTRMPQAFSAPALPDLPESITLPDGAVAEAVTYGQGYVIVVTTDGRILVLDKAGRVTREIPLVGSTVP
jgi:Family of unknown function (DUF6476)